MRYATPKEWKKGDDFMIRTIPLDWVNNLLKKSEKVDYFRISDCGFDYRITSPGCRVQPPPSAIDEGTRRPRGLPGFPGGWDGHLSSLRREQVLGSSSWGSHRFDSSNPDTRPTLCCKSSSSNFSSSDQALFEPWAVSRWSVPTHLPNSLSTPLPWDWGGGGLAGFSFLGLPAPLSRSPSM